MAGILWDHQTWGFDSIILSFYTANNVSNYLVSELLFCLKLPQVSLVGGKITQTRAGVRGIYVGVSVGGESVGLCREL